jgi:hypothetical protein
MFATVENVAPEPFCCPYVLNGRKQMLWDQNLYMARNSSC